MANLKNYVKEIVIVVVTFFFLLFITTNNNSALGTTYLQFLFGGIILLLITVLVFDKHLDVAIFKNKTSFLEEFFWGAGGWAVLLISSYFVLKAIDPLKASLGAVMTSLNATNPVFSNSIILNFLVVAFAIPFAETFVWGRGAEFFGDLFHIKINNVNKRRIGFIVLLGVLSSLFAIFHATSKNLSGTSLLIVFLMMAISIYLIAIRDGDMRAALVLHILANGVAAYLILNSGGTFIIHNLLLPLGGIR